MRTYLSKEAVAFYYFLGEGYYKAEYLGFPHSDLDSGKTYTTPNIWMINVFVNYTHPCFAPNDPQCPKLPDPDYPQDPDF